MKEQDYINKLDTLEPAVIVKGILLQETTFAKLKNSGCFDHTKQTAVRKLLKVEDDKCFSAAENLDDFKDYLSLFPEGIHAKDVEKKIQQMEEEESINLKKREAGDRMIREIKDDVNKFTIEEVKANFGNEDLEKLCFELGIDVNVVNNYVEPDLKFNDTPEKASDIPKGYTDVFFWGIPSSGKTCALSAILSTIKKDFTMEAPDCTPKFGSVYRTNLVNIFREDIGYLPARTNIDRTQYMPFLFYKRGEKGKRKISFFELSGEVFKYFYQVVNNTKITTEEDQENTQKSFDLLQLLLKSKNRKIHYFFIDYNKETQGTLDNNLTQDDYLNAAQVYFKDNDGIFKNNTDAVNVIITKSDEIEGDAQEKLVRAQMFLQSKFGNFMEILKSQCKTNSVDLEIKLFSVGDVYFKRICKINRDFSTSIIKDLLERVPVDSKSMFRKIFNS